MEQLRMMLPNEEAKKAIGTHHTGIFIAPPPCSAGGNSFLKCAASPLA